MRKVCGGDFHFGLWTSHLFRYSGFVIRSIQGSHVNAE